MARGVWWALLLLAGCDFDRAYADWAAKQDAGGSGGPSPCSTASWLLCDGFEGAALDPRWTTIGAGGTVTLDPSRAARGGQSVHFHLDPVAGGTQVQLQIEQTQISPATNATLYTRAFVLFTSSAAAGRLEFIQFQQAASPFQGIFLQREPDQFLSMVDYANPGTLYQKSATSSVPNDRWVCLEWETIGGAGTSGGMRVWVDGVASDLSIDNALVLEPSPPMAATQLGFVVPAMPDQTPVDLWMDELAMDTGRIGCQ